MTAETLAQTLRGAPHFDAPLSPANAHSFRAAMRLLASGVSVITRASGDELSGLTASSVTSLSAEPPALIVCVNRASTLYKGLAPGDTFGVNVLGADHESIANRFAGRTGAEGRARFAGAEWALGPNGAPLLVDAVAALECKVEEIIERNTHAILIARVLETAANPDAPALIYWRGEYDQLGWRTEEVARAVGVSEVRFNSNVTRVKFTD